MNDIEWKDIVGYEGLYQISNRGEVKKLKNNYILKKTLGNRGYYQLSLTKNGDRHTIRIHRLVAEAFIPNPLNLPQINHKDECKTNNYVDNLEWCTQAYNLDYKNGQKRRAKARNYEDISKMRSNKMSKEVAQMDYDGTVVAVWKNAYIAEKHGYNQSVINQCCLGKKETHKGYIWEYSNFIEKQLNGGWTNAIEKPSKSDDYLVYYHKKYDSCNFETNWYGICSFIDIYGGWQTEEGETILAWQSLPEPFKED